MPSSDKIHVNLSADVSGMVGPLLSAQTLTLHIMLEDAGFERTADRIVQHTGSGVMVAVNEDGYRISFHCPEARTGLTMIDMPPSTRGGEVANLARILHRAEST